MTSEVAPIFDAALALPVDLRANLAARLLESLDGPPDDRTPDDWARIIKERSDSLHRGDSDLIDGEIVIAKLQAVIDRASGAQ
jgi:hypothetical protein